MTVAEYADWWERKKEGLEEDAMLYLKDWHFTAEYPDYKVGYEPGLGFVLGYDLVF